MLRFLLVCLIITSGSAALADMRGLPTITVLAASSLTEPITEIARIYSRKSNVTVAVAYNSTADQAASIEEGESADVFIAAHPYWMAELKKMGLIDVYSLTNLVKNKLVLVVSSKGSLSDSPIPKTNLSDALTYLNNRSIMSMGDPKTSDIGLYTKQSLTTLDEKKGTKIWDNFNSKTIKSPNSKYNLYLISHGETAGITYYSEAYNNPEVRIVYTIDEKLHDAIIYQGAVVAGENMTNARAFLEFLQSKEAKGVFKKYGFVVD